MVSYSSTFFSLMAHSQEFLTEIDDMNLNIDFNTIEVVIN